MRCVDAEARAESHALQRRPVLGLQVEDGPPDLDLAVSAFYRAWIDVAGVVVIVLMRLVLTVRIIQS
jgi:hypothetical protein